MGQGNEERSQIRSFPTPLNIHWPDSHLAESYEQADSNHSTALRP